MQDCNG